MSKSVCIIGNMNNFPLLLAQGLVPLGYQVTLCVIRPDLLHRPQSKYRDEDLRWLSVIDCSDLTLEDFVYQSAKIDGFLGRCLSRRYDMFILNDYGPSFAEILPGPHVSLLTGSDVTYLGTYDCLRQYSASWDLEFKRSMQGRRSLRRIADLVSRQRDGILASERVSFAYRGLIPEGDDILDSIGVSDRRRVMTYLADTIALTPTRSNRGDTLRIFSGARVLWRQNAARDYSIQDLKGTDVLLEGFALYRKNGGKGRLRIAKKGQDVAAAFELCENLGIFDAVTWIDEMSLREFHNEIRDADLVCDQLAGSFPGMATLDSYASGRPVMANLRNDIFSGNLGEPLPGIQASTPEEVCSGLSWAESNRQKLQDLGMQSRLYSEKYLSPSAMAQTLLDGLC